MRVRKTDHFEDVSVAEAFITGLPDDAAPVLEPTNSRGLYGVRYWTFVVPPSYCYTRGTGGNV